MDDNYDCEQVENEATIDEIQINPQIILEKHSCKKINGELIELTVVRDDYLIGGTKQRAAYDFLKSRSEREVVYAGLSTDSAQVALSLACKTLNKHMCLFLQGDYNEIVAKSKRLGATVHMEKCNLKDLQDMAKDYAEKRSDRYLCSFGLDDKEYSRQLKESLISSIPKDITPPKRLWVAVGSGTLIRVLADIWKETIFMPVRIGKRFWEDQFDPTVWRRMGDGIDLELIASKQKVFEKVSAENQPPFPSVATYDAKVWQFVKIYGKNDDWIWNVAKDP